MYGRDDLFVLANKLGRRLQSIYMLVAEMCNWQALVKSSTKHVSTHQPGAATTWARRGEDLHRECTHQETGGFGFTSVSLLLSNPNNIRQKQMQPTLPGQILVVEWVWSTQSLWTNFSLVRKISPIWFLTAPTACSCPSWGQIQLWWNQTKGSWKACNPCPAKDHGAA